MTAVDDTRTLGEILGEALSPALTFEQELARLAADAQFISAKSLAGDVSEILRLPASQVFEAMTQVPDNMLSLLTSPEGWTALAAFVAADLGAGIPTYEPTIH